MCQSGFHCFFVLSLKRCNFGLTQHTLIKLSAILFRILSVILGRIIKFHGDEINLQNKKRENYLNQKYIYFIQNIPQTILDKSGFMYNFVCIDKLYGTVIFLYTHNNCKYMRIR